MKRAARRVRSASARVHWRPELRKKIICKVLRGKLLYQEGNSIKLLHRYLQSVPAVSSNNKTRMVIYSTFLNVAPF